MFVHLLCVEVGDQKTDIIALQKKKKKKDSLEVKHASVKDMTEKIYIWDRSTGSCQNLRPQKKMTRN